VLTNNNQKNRLSVCRRDVRLEVLQLPHELRSARTSLPVFPALPKSLLELDLLLSEDVANLTAITRTIRNDIGLTLQLLRTAAREIDGCSGKVMPISDLIVLAGLQRIKTMGAECASSSADRFQAEARQRFWMHVRLTAHVAEELADQTCDIGTEEAYLAGMFLHLKELPLLLNWEIASQPTRDLGEVVFEMARNWNLPPILADVIRGHKALCQTDESRVLLDLARVASTWAYRLEFLAARESESVRAKNPPYTLYK